MMIYTYLVVRMDKTTQDKQASSWAAMIWIDVSTIPPTDAMTIIIHSWRAIHRSIFMHPAIKHRLRCMATISNPPQSMDTCH